MKPVQMAVLMAGLSLLTFKSEAQSSFDFQYGYEDVYSANALNYVVQQQNIERSAEGNPAAGISYWNPINNGTTAILTQEFTFSAPTTEIFLFAHLASFNFGGGDYGSGSLWASTDDVNWVQLENGPTPPSGTLQANYVYNQDLPSSLLGANQIYIQTQLITSGEDILSQFERQDTTVNQSDTFTLDANVVPESSTVSLFVIGLAILAFASKRVTKSIA